MKRLRRVPLLALCLSFIIGVPPTQAARKNGKTSSYAPRDGSGIPVSSNGQGSLRSVADYLTDELKVDLERYDLGVKLAKQAERMGLSSQTLADNPDALSRIYRDVFSEQSQDSLAAIVSGLQGSHYPNAIVLGQPGVGKSFLTMQLAWMFAHGIMPDYLRSRLNISDPNTPAAVTARDFLGRTNVILVDQSLLAREGRQRGATPSQDVRIRNVLEDLFRYAKIEYANGEGNRTIFIFEEIAGMRGDVSEALKTILDESGYRPRGFSSFGQNDPGYHVVAMTTFEEYDRMVEGDSAVDGRYPTKVKVHPPSDEQVFSIVRKIADQEWSQIHSGIQLEDEALAFMIHMKRFLNWPPLEAPRSVITAVGSLYTWKAQHPGQDGLRISRRDAQLFLQSRSGLTSIWFEGPNGEPPMAGLADKLKELVVGHDQVIENIADIITTWVRLGQGREPPFIVLGGETGSGKDTIVMALNQVLFGHPGKDLILNMAGKRGFGVDAILEGPPLGNHSDNRPGLLQQALDRGQGNGIVAFNEAYDLPSEEFEKLKILIERGEIRPAGIDSRSRPLRYPVFIMGQFGEDASNIENLSPAEIDALFTKGKQDGSGAGAVPQALLDRAKKNGGVFALGPVPQSRYAEIIEIWLKVLKSHLSTSNQITLDVDQSVITHMVQQSIRTGLKVRGLYGIMSSLTEGAISKAMDEGLNVEDAKITIAMDPTTNKIVVEAVGAGKAFKFVPEDLLRIQGKCANSFTQ